MNQMNPEVEHSPDSSAPSTVQRLAAVPLSPKRTATTEPARQQPPQNPDVAREQRIDAKIAHNGQIITVITALSKILAIRLYLFFTLIGAFILGQNALDKGTWIALTVVVAYGMLTVLPLCILDDRLHRRPDQ